MGYAIKKIDLRADVGDVSLKALIDTGSNVTIINNDIAKGLEMAGIGGVELIGPIGEPMTGFYVYGTIRVVGTPIYTARIRIIVMNRMSFNMDSLIGKDFIATAKMNSNHQELQNITCEKCNGPIEKCDCTWLPFKLKT